MFADTDELKPYLKASAATHVGLVIAAALLATGKGGAPQDVYRIDFIGPTAGIANRNPEAAKASPTAPPARPAVGRPPPMQKPDEFARRRSGPLPKPSFLQPGRPEPVLAEPPPPAAPAAPAPQAAEPAAAGSGEAAAEGSDANVSADLPNFPYPWYITQVRSSLWSRWSARMPRTPGGATIMFIILRDGSLTDLRVESSSGDAGYDYAALTSVQEAAPFAPLPSGFRESFLKIHVRFTSQ
ncbi:MAG: TonB family protein [Elusimicrobia bacterium]|nr:TonB family protein [Elusimicrobiota bacterium]